MRKEINRKLEKKEEEEEEEEEEWQDYFGESEESFELTLFSKKKNTLLKTISMCFSNLYPKVKP